MTPILAKELGVGARLRRTYALRAFYGLVLAFALWSRFEMEGYSFNRLTTSQVASLGRELFSTFVIVQFIGVTVFSLLAGADFVVKEVRADTLGLLVLTPLSGRDIVTGKWLAAIAQSTYLMLCGLPVLAACLYLGAVGFEDLVVVVFSTLSSSILASAFSVWTASHGRNPYGAGALAGLAYMGYFLLCLIPEVLISRSMGLFHPLGYLLAGSVATEPAGAPHLGFITIIPACLGLSWLILHRAGALLTSPATLAPRSVRTSKDIVDRQAYLEQAARNLGTRIRESEVWEKHPLLWKDIRTRPAAQLSYEIRLGLGLFAGMLFAGSLFAGSPEQLLFFHALFPASILMAVSAGSGLFFRDRDSGRIDTLRVLPIRAWEVLRSKLASGPASPEGTVLLILLLLSLHVFFLHGDLQLGCQAAVAVLLFLAFAYILGALGSLVLHKTRLAILAAGSLVLGLLLWSDRSPASPYYFLDRPQLSSILGVYAAIYLFLSGLLVWILIVVFRGRFRA